MPADWAESAVSTWVFDPTGSLTGVLAPVATYRSPLAVRVDLSTLPVIFDVFVVIFDVFVVILDVFEVTRLSRSLTAAL
jgi:hypothetical protein